MQILQARAVHLAIMSRWPAEQTTMGRAPHEHYGFDVKARSARAFVAHRRCAARARVSKTGKWSIVDQHFAAERLRMPRTV